MLTTKIYNEQGQIPNFTIEVKYPQIIGNQLSHSELEFNQLAKASVMQVIKTFKKTVAENEKYHIPPEAEAHGSSLKINYDVATIDPKLFVSVRYNIASNYAGSAHPTVMYQSLNYDLHFNKKATIPVLFKPKSNYLQHIADYATNILKPKLKFAFFKEGTAPVVKNYQVWNITPKGLRITFNEYQVAAYVYGPQEIIVPYDYLKGILSEHTSLGACVNNLKQCQIIRFNQ